VDNDGALVGFGRRAAPSSCISERRSRPGARAQRASCSASSSHSF
jgi:hypothetical protein